MTLNQRQYVEAWPVAVRAGNPVGFYSPDGVLTGSNAATPREAQQNALAHARGRLLQDGRMYTANLVCRCGEIVSEGWMARHLEINHPWRSNAT